MRFIVRRYNSVPDADDDKSSSPDYSRKDGRPLSRSTSPVGSDPSDPDSSPQHIQGGSSKETFISPDNSMIHGPQGSVVNNLITPVARRGRAFAERQTARLVSKVGESFISNQNITGKKSKFIVDIFK